jgi:hypothetical protein
MKRHRRRVTLGSALGQAQAGMSAAPGAADAITNGQATFTAALSKAGSAGLNGTLAMAAGIVQELPSGSLTTALNTVIGLGEDAAAGAAVGSIIPGIGTAVGAAVGVIMAVVGDILGGGGPAAPENEFRTSAEKLCFPGIDLTNDNTKTDPQVLPVGWITQRPSLVALRVNASPDPAAGMNGGPITFNFGVGWVPAPGSTPDTADQVASQALSLAQAYIAQNPVSKALAIKTLPKQSGVAASLQTVASTAFSLGEDDVATGIALLTRWYGPPGHFALGFSIPTSISDGNGYVNGLSSLAPAGGHAYAAAFSNNARQVQSQTALDYLYYVSDTFAMEDFQGGTQADQYQMLSAIEAAATQAEVQSFFSYNPIRHAVLVDTLVCGLSEIACNAIAGVYDEPDGTKASQKSLDVIALHYVTSLAYLWHQGQLEDQQAGLQTAQLEIRTHDNFSRVIGIVQSYLQPSQAAIIAADQAQVAKITAALPVGGATHTSTNPTLTSGAGSATAGYALINGVLTALKSPTASASSPAGGYALVNGKLTSTSAGGYALVNGKLVSTSLLPSSSTSAPKGTYETLAVVSALALIAWWQRASLSKVLTR